MRGSDESGGKVGVFEVFVRKETRKTIDKGDGFSEKEVY